MVEEPKPEQPKPPVQPAQAEQPKPQPVAPAQAPPVHATELSPPVEPKPPKVPESPLQDYNKRKNEGKSLTNIRTKDYPAEQPKPKPKQPLPDHKEDEQLQTTKKPQPEQPSKETTPTKVVRVPSKEPARKPVKSQQPIDPKMQKPVEPRPPQVPAREQPFIPAEAKPHAFLFGDIMRNGNGEIWDNIDLTARFEELQKDHPQAYNAFLHLYGIPADYPAYALKAVAVKWGMPRVDYSKYDLNKLEMPEDISYIEEASDQTIEGTPIKIYKQSDDPSTGYLQISTPSGYIRNYPFRPPIDLDEAIKHLLYLYQSDMKARRELDENKGKSLKKKWIRFSEMPTVFDPRN